MSRECLDKLESELQYLKTVREREVAEQIKEARSFGDLSENSEYDEAKNEQGKLYSRIAEIENILANAELLEAADTADEAGVGNHVTLLEAATGERFEYSIVGTQEANPRRNRISDESPLGRALLGHKVGDEIKFEAAAGVMTFVIEAITS